MQEAGNTHNPTAYHKWVDWLRHKFQLSCLWRLAARRRWNFHAEFFHEFCQFSARSQLLSILKLDRPPSNRWGHRNTTGVHQENKDVICITNLQYYTSLIHDNADKSKELSDELHFVLDTTNNTNRIFPSQMRISRSKTMKKFKGCRDCRDRRVYSFGIQ